MLDAAAAVKTRPSAMGAAHGGISSAKLLLPSAGAFGVTCAYFSDSL
jgi:hypothetical protein